LSAVPLGTSPVTTPMRTRRPLNSGTSGSCILLPQADRMVEYRALGAWST
jgi:hypothetical protein